jgi:16S rRNA (cytidine1402-2'-O)-methyltransferase
MYLIPCTLGENENMDVIPADTLNNMQLCNSFVVENLRTARRYLRKAGFNKDFDSMEWFEFNKHGNQDGLKQFLEQQIITGSIGLLSESGCPCIADPGSIAVQFAHELNINVVPLVGPSSILLTLISSGFNGQSFCFHGYLPIDKAERTKKITVLEQAIYQQNQTQLFIETPFRNNQMLAQLLSSCKPTTKLCIASELTLANQYIKTLPIAQWKNTPIDLHKKMVVFTLYK